jgi:hypothetical protein
MKIFLFSRLRYYYRLPLRRSVHRSVLCSAIASLPIAIGITQSEAKGRTLHRPVRYSAISKRFTIINISSLLIAVAFILTSCEKVIQLDLNNAERKYVIEAVITDQPGTAKVLITQTKDFDEDNNFPGISGAVVTIHESGGATTTLTETSAGKYESAALTGTSGKAYELSVTIGGKTFSASSTMPQKVNLDTIYVTDEFIFTDTRKIANADYHDPAGKGNNYRFIQYVNGLKEKQLFIQNDDFTDGRLNNNKLFYFTDEDDDSTIIKSGDNVRIDLLCIDPNIYKYWFSLNSGSTGSGDQAAPSNPVTNMQGGALGYFSAHTLQTKAMIAP